MKRNINEALDMLTQAANEFDARSGDQKEAARLTFESHYKYLVNFCGVTPVWDEAAGRYVASGYEAVKSDSTNWLHLNWKRGEHGALKIGPFFLGYKVRKSN